MKGVASAINSHRAHRRGPLRAGAAAGGVSICDGAAGVMVVLLGVGEQVIVSDFPETIFAAGHGAPVLGARAPLVAEDQDQVGTDGWIGVAPVGVPWRSRRVA